MPAASIATAPRGLALLADFCGENLDPWSPGQPPQLRNARPVLGEGLRYHFVDPSTGDLVAEDRTAPILHDPEELAREALGVTAGFAWWGDRQRIGSLVVHGDVFHAVAEGLLAARGASWWEDDVHRARQVVLGPPDRPPDLEALAAEQAVLARSSWRIPQALTSSLGLGERLPAVRLCAGEAVYRWIADRGPVGCWAVEVDASARVYEVHGVDDWAELCARYPHRGPTPPDYVRWGVTTPTSAAPDWQSVQRDWDGVHVSMMAVFGAAGVPVEVEGAGAVIEDVDSEFTTWFRPRFGELTLAATIPAEQTP